MFASTLARARTLMWRLWPGVACILALPLMTAWQAQLQPLSDAVGACIRGGDCDVSDRVWYDFASVATIPVHESSARVMRDNMNTFHLAANVWFIVAVAHRNPKFVTRWAVLWVTLFIQPGLHTTTSGVASGTRSEPPLDHTWHRVFFPTTYADVTNLEFPIDPHMGVAMFVSHAFLAAHAGIGAWIITVAYQALTIVYCLTMRRISTPSLILTQLLAWTLVRDVVCTHTEPTEQHDDCDTDTDTTTRGAPPLDPVVPLFTIEDDDEAIDDGTGLG